MGFQFLCDLERFLQIQSHIRTQIANYNLCNKIIRSYCHQYLMISFIAIVEKSYLGIQISNFIVALVQKFAVTLLGHTHTAIH